MQVSVFVSGEGYIDRTFRNKGEAIGFLNKTYGDSWRKRQVRFENQMNVKSYDGFLHEKK